MARLMLRKMASLWLVKCRKLLFFISQMVCDFHKRNVIGIYYRLTQSCPCRHAVTHDLCIIFHLLACFPVLFLKRKHCRGLSWCPLEWIPDIFPSLEAEAWVLRSCSETRMVWRLCYISSVFISS